MPVTRLIRFGIGAAALPLVLVACSSTETATTAASTAKPAASVAPTTKAPSAGTSAAPGTTPASTKDIVDTAVAAGDFSTLAAALKAAALIDTLKGPGPFTVFAPTDAAFKALPAGTVDDLLKPENKETLTTVLTYHVVKGNVMAADVVKLDGKEVETVAGPKLMVKVTGDKVTLTDTSGNTINVVKTDIKAKNGVIHVIDGVLIPKSTEDIVDTAVAAGDFSTLAAALKAAALIDTLKGPGPFTVFAPTDAAFKALPAGTVDDLLKPENKETLTTVLTYHVVKGNVMAADVVKLDGKEVETVAGPKLMVKVTGDKVTLTDTSGNTINVVKTDIKAKNGVIHVIDGVLIPKS